GTYEEGTLYVLSQLLKQGGIFIDIGANLGLMSLLAAKCLGPAGRVIAFEPMPSTNDLLCQNIAINGLDNVQSEMCALGSQPSVAHIYTQPGINRGAATLIEQPGGHSYEVRVHTIDGFVEEQDLENIVCLKIDVEGWELEVLRGARQLLASERPPA